MERIPYADFLRLQKNVEYTEAWVYFLYHGDELLYIGSTNSLTSRMYKHRRGIISQTSTLYEHCRRIGIQFDDLVVKTLKYNCITDGELREQEKFNIIMRKPICNETFSKSKPTFTTYKSVKVQTEPMDTSFCISCSYKQRSKIANLISKFEFFDSCNKI